MEKVRNYIYNLLGFKDYTESEIRKKVSDKFKDNVIESELNNIIDYLKENNYINDDAFIKSYIESKYSSDYGWNKIYNDLTFKKNIKESSFINYKENYDWFEKAKEYKIRKFGYENTEDYKTTIKQKQKLLRRGFSMEEVEYAFS